jgi:uncharacterized membrane protein YbhN (UPF0104 family)
LTTILSLSIVLYTALLVCISKGFAQLLGVVGIEHVTFQQALAVWGKANIAKYLPSNLLHFAGRQVLGAGLRWPQASIALATILEIAIQIIVPSCLIILGLAQIQRFELLSDVMWLLPLIAVAGVALAVTLAHKRLWHRVDRYLPNIFKVQISKQPLRAIALSATWYSLFFLGMCLIVTALYSLLQSPIEGHDVLTLNAVFLTSWIVGFVVPGAPGGIGVREGTFAMIGGAFFPVEGLVLVALLMRLITLAGEGLLFFLAAWLDRSEPAIIWAAPPQPSRPAHQRQHN